MKNLIIGLLLLPVASLACTGNEKNDVDFYSALLESKSASNDYDLKHDVSEALTESMMKNISCGGKMVTKNEPSILPDSFLISIQYENLTY